MNVRRIDCDLHPVLDSAKRLVPYLADYWRDQVITRGIDNLDLTTYPPKAPITSRKDWRPAKGRAGTDIAQFRTQALDAFSCDLAICNVIYGSQAMFNVDLGAAFCQASNEWLAKEWLDQEPRLRGSIVVPMQNAALAVEEIERRAPDRRFVQVLMLAAGDEPLGRRNFWPIYEAAEKWGLPIGIHAGSAGRYATTYSGWPSFQVEDYSAQAQTFQGQLLSLVYEGVFQKFPTLKFVLIESGVTWLPGWMSRADNTWRSLRNEVPWIEKPPSELVREHVRLTTQPFDAPEDSGIVADIIRQIGSEDMLLFATDYPHWQFDGDDVMPFGFTPELIRKITLDNPQRTYPRLTEVLQ